MHFDNLLVMATCHISPFSIISEPGAPEVIFIRGGKAIKRAFYFLKRALSCFLRFVRRPSDNLRATPIILLYSIIFIYHLSPLVPLTVPPTAPLGLGWRSGITAEENHIKILGSKDETTNLVK